MKLALDGVVPRANCALEDHTIARIQEHLCAATCHALIRRVVLFEDNTDITHSIPDTLHSPRPATALVKGSCTEIPSDSALEALHALLSPRTALRANVLQCRFPYYLGCDVAAEQAGFELVAKVLLIGIRPGCDVLFGEKGWRRQEGLRFFCRGKHSRPHAPELRLDNGFWPAILTHDVRHHHKPDIGLYFFIRSGPTQRISVQFHGLIDPLMGILKDNAL